MRLAERLPFQKYACLCTSCNMNSNCIGEVTIFLIDWITIANYHLMLLYRRVHSEHIMSLSLIGKPKRLKIDIPRTELEYADGHLCLALPKVGSKIGDRLRTERLTATSLAHLDGLWLCSCDAHDD
jgi:hypothetical protein